jgi:phosphoglycerol transferase MdoB-like AlkP superfamily enzyme
MEQSTAVWFVIVLAIVTANLPFLIERPLLALPWARAGDPSRPAGLRWLESLVFFVLLAALAYFVRPVIGNATFSGGDPASIMLFLVKLAGVLVVAVLLLSYAGWRRRGAAVHKPFFERLLEVLVFFVLVGMLGFGFEMNIGNPFQQGWQFSAVSLSLFLVLGYPGFVYRYLMRHRTPGKKDAAAKPSRRPAAGQSSRAATHGG